MCFSLKSLVIIGFFEDVFKGVDRFMVLGFFFFGKRVYRLLGYIVVCGRLNWMVIFIL